MLNGEIDANDLELELGNHNSLEGEIVETQGLEGEIQGQTEKVNGVDIYGELLDNGIVKYDGTIQKLRTILADTELDVNSHNVVENQAIASKVNEIETDIDNIGTEVDNISQRVTTAEGEISTINQEITTIEGNVSNLQQNKQDKVDNSLETSDKTVSGAINELKSAIDNIDVSIDGTTITRNSDDELQAVAITDGTNVIGVSDINNIGNRVTTIEGKIPEQASSTNKLADKAFVNSTVQTATANFRGNWMNWASVPINADEYPEDYTGTRTPSTNDYMVVQDASGYVDPDKTLEGTWRFKYTGVWGTDGRNGWMPEYQVNETPFTAAQLAAINSGATENLINQITTNENAIYDLQSTKANDNEVVHLTGNETIGGNKSFTGRITGSNTSNYITIDGAFNFYNGGAQRLSIGAAEMHPITTNFDIGRTANKFRDLYLSGALKDGTDSLTINKIASGLFNVINASDIPSTKILTDEQYALITNGRPTLIKGSFDGYSNYMLTPRLATMGGYDVFVAICQKSNTPTFIGFSVNTSNHQAHVRTDRFYIDAYIGAIKGKSFPTYPSSPTTNKVLTYKTDDTLSWEDSAGDANFVHKTGNEEIDGIKTFKIKPRVLCSSDLPSEYQEVEYLESQGEQWIDIGIDYDTIGSKLSVETSIYYDQTITSNQYIFGSAASSGRYLNPRIETNNTMTVVTGGGSANLVIQGISIGSFTKKDLTFEVDGKNFKVHANNRNYTGTASGTPTSTGNIALFGLNSASSSFAGRIYYFRLYDGTGVLIRNLVPCYRKSDNEAGVYDLVNDVFYTNSGEGAFTVGADVTSKEVLTENDLSWGNIKGTLANQTDLQSVLDSKMDDGDVAAVSGDSDNNNYLHKIKINGTTYDLPQFVKPTYNPERYGIGIGHGAFVRGYGITIGRNSGANFGGQNFITIGAWSNIADRVINLGHDNKNTIPETFCFDGVEGSHGSGMTVEKANRTMLVYDTDHIFFRNEDLKAASSKSAYTNGRTLSQYLDEKADNLNVIHPNDVIDNVTSIDIDKPLSANMGKELNDRIQNLAGIGKYLAMWDCTTGLPTTNPTTMPYSYTTGDYYVIKTVGTTNYMPNGSSYTGVASTTEYTGTEELSIGDFWLYDGTSWSLMKNSGRTVTFATISGNPTDNSNLASALNGKLDKVTTTSSTNEVYAKGSDGSQMRIPVAQSVINGSIALRGSSGNLKVGTPISTDDATTKDYVDNALSGKVDTTIKVNNKALSGDITLYGTDIKRNSSTLNSINDDITSLDNAFTYLNGEVTTLQGTVSGHTSSISTINTMIGDIDTELATQQQSINNLSTSISNHTSQISTLQANDLAMASNITALQNNKEQIVASSFGENGYIKYNSGVIIQWGVYVLDQGNGRDKNIVFPTPFSSTNYGVVTSHYQGTISNDYINSFKIVDKASTYFTVRKHFSESGEKALYIAVGK